MTAEDARLVAAREYLVEKKYTKGYKIAGDLLAYAEERLRVNVGLANENATFRAKARQPESLDLSGVATRDLIAELESRCAIP